MVETGKWNEPVRVGGDVTGCVASGDGATGPLSGGGARGGGAVTGCVASGGSATGNIKIS